MRLRETTVATVLGVALLAGVGTAKAQTEITITGGAGGVAFTGEGSSSTTQEKVTLGKCTGTTCVVKGTGSGTGMLASGPAKYTLTSTLGTIFMTLINATLGEWSVTQTAPILFSYGTGGSLLTGDLNLLSFEQAPGSHSGVFNYNGVADLTITGGSLAGAFTSAGGILTVDLIMHANNNVMSVLGTRKTVGGSITGGQLLPTPEPNAAAIFLLGAGMLLAGSLLRRRSTQSKANS